MQILSTRPKHTQAKHLVIMFGLGMIGSAIRNSLLEFDFKVIEKIDFHWNDAENRERTFAVIETACRSHSPSIDRVSIIWSAGKTNFHSTVDEINRENIPFLETVKFVSRLKETLELANLSFHFISSAGGLFEGQQVVTHRSIPGPLRPYGRLKLTQEQVLKSTFESNEFVIYRPSSVYGPMSQKSQQGLINNLVSNGRNGQVTVIDAHVMSLRDYVFSGDIGEFIAKRIRIDVAEKSDNPVHFLVSARCASIFEIIQKIERTLHLNLQFRYDASFGNHSNITFSENVLPTGWSPSTLNVGIRQFLINKYAG